MKAKRIWILQVVVVVSLALAALVTSALALASPAISVSAARAIDPPQVPAVPAIVLTKTVGTNAAICATTDGITVITGTSVYYCYRVQNRGTVTLTRHDLVDNRLGTILSNFPFILTPGASIFVTQTTIITQTTVNTATWTAYNPGPTDAASDTDPATVFAAVPEPLVCNAGAATFDSGIPSNWMVVTNSITNPNVIWTTLPGCGEAGNWTGGAGGAACTVSDLLIGHYDTELRSPPFDLSGFVTASVNYQANYQNFAFQDFLDLDISANGGGSWTTLLSWNDDHGAFRSPSGEAVSVDLSAYAGMTGLILRWHYYDPPTADGNDWYAQVDNVSLACATTIAAPVMIVTPNTVTSTQPLNDIMNRTVTISNVGTSNLDWQIYEATALSVAEASVDASASQTPTLQGGDPAKATEDVAEDEPIAPPTGEDPAPAADGPNPLYTPPVASAASSVLYNNGPLVNSPGTGAGGANESMLQSTTLGMNTLGFGHQVAVGNRVADDFTVTSSGGWLIDSITFYAYQTGSPLTSTITAVNYRIWNGPPDSVTSDVVLGTTTANRLVNSAWSGIYRVTEATSGDTTRPIMANTVSAGIFLPPGTYWLDWQSGGSLASGPWVPPITISGVLTTGNGLQFSGAWARAFDGGTSTQQGFPFIISGCPVSNVPWASVLPSAGTTAPGAATGVTVTLDSTGLATGIYTGTLCINSNDPNRPVATVPLTLTVEPTQNYLPIILRQ